MGKTASIKEKLADITKKAIKAQEDSYDLEDVFTEDDETEEIGELLEDELNEIVDEIIDFVYMAAEEGKYEFEVGNYIEKFGRRNYHSICYALKTKLYDVMIIKTTKKNNVTIFWGNNEV